jgi:hypothetical protein
MLKNLINGILILCLGGIYLSCKEENNRIFNGEIVLIAENHSDIDTLTGNEIKLDGIYTGQISVYDTLILFSSYLYPGHLSLLFDIKTGKQIREMIKIGQGPDEFVTPTTSGQLDIDSTVCSWIYDWGKQRCVAVDWINNSQNKIIELSHLVNNRQMIFTGIFILNDSLLLAYNQGEQMFLSESNNTLVPPIHRLFNYRTGGEEIVRHDIFNNFQYNEIKPPQLCLVSSDCIKPDNTKVAMSMMYFRQLNILDIATGKITGYRFKDTPDFDILRKGSPVKELQTYCTGAYADDDLIYSVNINEKNTTIDVFDWNGIYKRKLFLDTMVYNIALDPVNKYLYALVSGEDDEEVYRYDVSYLYK